MLPLTGLRVIAVEHYGAGPFGTQHLADFGADVIKVESKAGGGDVSRSVGPHFIEGAAGAHARQCAADAARAGTGWRDQKDSGRGWLRRGSNRRASRKRSRVIDTHALLRR